MAKPFSIQAPEDIAKQYGGDKSKIAQAAQMGLLDPTAAVLAGMFIDKMRSAAQGEMAPQQTIAQQVMTPQPAAPSPGLANRLAALGGAPQPQMPMGAPQMGAEQAPMPEMPMGMPEQAPMGMAEGGLAGIDIPDSMYDEPTNGGFDDGYAGGGLVAFGDGGPVGPYIEERVRDFLPNAGVSSRLRTAARNRAVGGNPRSFHLTNDARDFVPPKGMSLTQLGDTIRKQLGSDYDVIYNTKGHYDHVHVEPRSRRGARSAEKAPVKAKVEERPAPAKAEAPAPTPAKADTGLAALADMRGEIAELAAQRQRDLAEARKDRRSAAWMGLAERGLGMLGPQQLPEGFAVGGPVNEDIVVEGDVGRNYYGFNTNPDEMRATVEKNYKPEREAGQALMDYFKDVVSPEYMGKRRKEDMWHALTKIGATMAMTPGTLLQAASAGIGAAQQDVQTAAKERRAEQRAAIAARAQQEGLNNKEALDFEKLILEGTSKAGDFDVARLTREQQERLKIYEEKMANWRTQQQVAGGITQARIGAQGQRDAASQQALAIDKAARRDAFAQATKDAEGNAEFRKARVNNDTATMNNIILGLANQYYGVYTNMGGSGGGGNTPPPPAGFTPD